MKGIRRFVSGMRLGREGLFALVLCIAMLGAGFLLQYYIFPDGLLTEASQKAEVLGAEMRPVTPVRINEVMASNKTALRDETGAYPDWIELVNVGDAPHNITGWTLADRTDDSSLFTFPQRTLAPGEHVIVFASNRTYTEGDGPYHAPFKISAAGELLMVFDAATRVVESINIPALDADQSYARTGEGWMVTYEYTPGRENTPENHALWVSRTPDYPVTLFINELMASNVATLKDADGEAHDYIELYNAGDAPIALAGYALTDDADDLDQWIFPDVTLGPGEYKVVFASGKDRREGDELHTNFSLRAEGERVLLLDADVRIIGDVTYDNLRDDQAFIRTADGNYALTQSPTPGAENGR